ncbi:MAG: hypothetical protein Kow0065_11350 [Methylomicrobium sp.]
MDLNTAGTLASIVSLVLAIVFWLLASKQATKADRTLSEIKDKIMSWQDRMNTAAINLIEARPEVIAQKVSLEEAKNNAEFIDRLAGVIERLATEADEKSTGYKMALMKELLEHQKSLIVDRDKIKADYLAQRGKEDGG